MRELQRLPESADRRSGEGLGRRGHRSTRRRWRSIPDNRQFKIALDRARREASRAHFEKGKALRAAADQRHRHRSVPPRADGRHRAPAHRASSTPTNQFAAVELVKAVQLINDINRAASEQVSIDDIKKRAQSAITKAQPPQLNPASNEPISLTFSARHAGQGHLPRPRQRLRHQRPLRPGRQGRPHHHRAARRHRAGRRSSASCRPPITSTRSSTRRPSSSSPTTRRPAAITKTWSSARSISRTATPSRSPTSSGR